jgi:tripartite-type tricarboxylate transporter receptor subunit TctC
MVQEGRFRLLCTWGPERPRRFNEAPTLRDLGIDIVATSPYGLAGPRGMEPAVVHTLHDAFKEALYDPAHLAALDRYDMLVLYLDSAAYAEAARQYQAAEREILQRVGLLPR